MFMYVSSFFFLYYFLVERIFHVGKYLELQFEFKTSELNGVLLSVAEPVGFPALSIEMYNGKVSEPLYIPPPFTPAAPHCTQRNHFFFSISMSLSRIGNDVL